MSRKPVKLLAIEDNLGDVALLKEMLAQVEDLPVELVHTEWLSTGTAILAKEDIDVVLLDVLLPDSRGFNALTSVLEQAPDVPVVILSALDDDLMADKLVRGGAHSYLIKGQVDAAQLAAAIRRAVGRGER